MWHGVRLAWLRRRQTHYLDGMAGTLPEPFPTGSPGAAGPRVRISSTAACAQRGNMLLIARPAGARRWRVLPSLVGAFRAAQPGLHTLYVSPLKALAADIARNLMGRLRKFNGHNIDTRTGDTSSDRRRKQREMPPNILLTTPESLGAADLAARLRKMFSTLSR